MVFTKIVLKPVGFYGDKIARGQKCSTPRKKIHAYDLEVGIFAKCTAVTCGK